MQKIEARFFDTLKERYGNAAVHFAHTDDYTLVAIPEWNWCYLWDVFIEDKLAKKQCVDSLSDPMFPDAAVKLTDEIYDYLMGRSK